MGKNLKRSPLRRLPFLLVAVGVLAIASLVGGGMAHEPLAAGHGAPVRLVAEGRRGFWWVKWVSRVDIDNLPPWWQPPLPLA